MSDFYEFEEENEEKLKEEVFLFPQNFGKQMAIDETGLVNGELYTFVINKEAKGRKGTIAAMIKGTKSSVISKAIIDQVPFDTLLDIKEITMDLANNMEWIAYQIAPQSRKTYDRFHVQQLVTEAVQTIRIKHRWEAIDEENEAKDKNEKYESPRYSNGDTKKQLLARSRYLLFKPSSKWNEQQKERSKILFKEFPIIKKAYDFSMYFRNCYEQVADHSFEDWIKKAQESDIKEMRVVSKTIKKRLFGIKSYFSSKSTNANIESFNAKLKLFRRNTRGVKDRNFFFYRIFKYFA